MKKVKRQCRFAFFICKIDVRLRNFKFVKSLHMPHKFIIHLISLSIFVVLSASSVSAAPSGEHVEKARQVITQCTKSSGDNRFAHHRCLLQEYERLQKRTDRLTDKLLGIVGAQRAYGRLKIIQWSNAITKSQSRWQKLVPWNCEWEGHILPSAKGAAVAIDRCGVLMAAKRVQLLEKRLEALNIAIANDKGKEK